MNLQEYKKNREALNAHCSRARSICVNCWQPQFNCFCEHVERFDPQMEFVILIHPIESRRRIATGRMTYLGLQNSHIVRGTGFQNCPTINALLADNNYNNVLLSPGVNSIDLTDMSETKKVQHFKTDKKLRIFVIDGTWSNASKMIAKSPNLKALPRFCFTPKTPSKITVRKQPNANCYSTLEATHHIIELLGPSQGFNISERPHDKLLKPFYWMVNQQIERLKTKKRWRFIANRK